MVNKTSPAKSPTLGSAASRTKRKLVKSKKASKAGKKRKLAKSKSKGSFKSKSIKKGSFKKKIVKEASVGRGRGRITLKGCIQMICNQLENFECNNNNRKMLKAALPLALSDLKSERHPHQQAVLACVDEALRSIDHDLTESVAQEQIKLDEVSTRAMQLRQAIQVCETQEKKKSEELTHIRAELTDSKVRLKQAEKEDVQNKKTLKEVKDKIKTRQDELTAFQRMIEKDFMPLYEGTTTGAKHIKSFMEQINKMSASDEALTKVLPLALAKAKDKRGGFDDLALTYAYNTTEQYKHSLEEELATLQQQLVEFVQLCEDAITRRHDSSLAVEEADKLLKETQDAVQESRINGRHHYKESVDCNRVGVGFDRTIKNLQKKQGEFRRLLAAFRVFLERDHENDADVATEKELIPDNTESEAVAEEPSVVAAANVQENWDLINEIQRTDDDMVSSEDSNGTPDASYDN